MKMDYNSSMVKGKKILVVGLANKYSIAAAISSSLYENGATLGFSYQNDRFEKFINEFSGDNGGGFTQVCDLSSDNDIKKLISTAIEKWGKIDGIVHSVGFAPADQISGNIEDCITREGFQITHDVSSYSFAGLLKEAHPHMSENSSIITLTYVGSQEATPNYNVMGLAKASLEANTRFLAASLGKKGIRVNAIAPGLIKTDFSKALWDNKKTLNKQIEITPLKRIGYPEDISGIVHFLASNASSFITGQLIIAVGGETITSGIT